MLLQKDPKLRPQAAQISLMPPLSELQMQNYVVKIYNDGEKYEGQFKDDKRHGKGIFYYASGDKYDGEWKNNNRHGKGIEYYADGAKYDGEWKYGYKHGRGIQYFADGD